MQLDRRAVLVGGATSSSRQRRLAQRLLKQDPNCASAALSPKRICEQKPTRLSLLP